MDRVNNISFGANFVSHVHLNKSRWEGIGKQFEEITSTYPGYFHLIQTTLHGDKKVYYLATKAVNGVIRAEDTKLMPSDILGKWIMDLEDKDIAKKLAKIFGIMKIRKQSVYDMRKVHGNNSLMIENIADKYLERMKRITANDEDILLPPYKVDTQKHSIWNGLFDAKSELFRLQHIDAGQHVVTKID